MSRDARPEPTESGWRFRLGGSIQGVGFRPWVWREAHLLGLLARQPGRGDRA